MGQIFNRTVSVIKLRYVFDYNSNFHVHFARRKINKCKLHMVIRRRKHKRNLKRLIFYLALQRTILFTSPFQAKVSFNFCNPADNAKAHCDKSVCVAVKMYYRHILCAVFFTENRD